MPSRADHQVSFEDEDARDDAMHRTINDWISDLADSVDEARASEQFKDWLDVQARFHDYSHRNTLLIKAQCPEATRVAGYRTWQREFDRHVKEGESAIWIWAPIVTTRCPECENAPSYHESIDCEYDDTAPEEWDEGLVGFRPAPVFDVSQTEGESLPEIDTTTVGEAADLLPALTDAASSLDVGVEFVDPDAWSHGDARGVCHHRSDRERPHVAIKDGANDADLATTLVHEYAHALLHDGVDAKRNVRSARSKPRRWRTSSGDTSD